MNRKHEHNCELNSKCPECKKQCDICKKNFPQGIFDIHRVECQQKEEKRKKEEEERKKREEEEELQRS